MAKRRLAVLGALLAVVSVGGAALATSGAAQTSGGTTPSNGEPHPPATPNVHAATFSQCPPIGVDSGCAILIVVNPDGTVSLQTDPSQPPYENDEDTLIGVQNNAQAVVTSLTLTGVTTPKPTFGFDGDGLCTESNAPSGCPFGSTGYEGPGTSFSSISADKANGTVNFSPGIGPGGTAYFSLEGAISATNLTITPIQVPKPAPAPTLFVQAAQFTG